MKVYLATPMNGKSIEHIKENIANCASFLATKGIDFFNPFLEITAQANSIDALYLIIDLLRCCVIQQNL